MHIFDIGDMVISIIYLQGNGLTIRLKVFFNNLTVNVLLPDVCFMVA